MHRIILLVVFLPAALLANMAPLEYRLVSTDINGAQTQIDLNHTTIWSFTLPANVSWLLKGGSLTMKDGPHTAADSQFTLWEGAIGSTQVAQVILTNAQFSAQTGNDQQFGVHDYFFSPMVTLSGGAAGRQYTLALSSSAPDQQSEAYFIKGTNASFKDQNGDPLPPGWGDIGETTVSEPSSVLLVAGVLLAAAGRVSFRRRKPSLE